MPQPVAEFAAKLLKEAQETHPWLHHPLFRMIADGELSKSQVQQVILQQGCFFLEALCGGNIATESINAIVCQRLAGAMEKHYGVPKSALDFYHEHMEVEGDHSDRAVRILSKVAVSDEEQKRGLLALRRAITARRICTEG